MQKKLIAVAVAALMSGAAFAESNVEIYGVADAYFANIKNDGYKSFNDIGSGGLSGNRIGLKGAEDLGNGMKALFQYELGSLAIEDTSNGNGMTSTRQSYVGLAGSFGAVVAGRLQLPGYYVGSFDALASAAISPQAILANGPMIGGLLGTTIAPNNMARANNAIAYLSPDFGGFTAVVGYSTDALGGEGQIASTCTDAPAPAGTLGLGTGCKDASAFALGLNYATGPVKVGFVHHNVSNGADGLDAVDVSESMIGGSYNAGFLTVLGSYQTSKLKDTDTNKLYQIGVVVPVGAGNVHVAYGKLNMNDDTWADSDAKSYTVAYTHGLSKRTTAYAGYNVTSNDTNASEGIGAVDAGGKAKALVVGLRHTF